MAWRTVTLLLVHGLYLATPYPAAPDDDDEEFYPAEDMVAVAPHVNPMVPRPPHPTTRSLIRQPRIRGSAENLVGKVIVVYNRENQYL